MMLDLNTAYEDYRDSDVDAKFTTAIVRFAQKRTVLELLISERESCKASYPLCTFDSSTYVLQNKNNTVFMSMILDRWKISCSKWQRTSAKLSTQIKSDEPEENQ